MTKTTCDRCGKELSPGEGVWLGASLRNPRERSKLEPTGTTFLGVTPSFVYDMCSGCMADLSRFMKELEE